MYIDIIKNDMQIFFQKIFSSSTLFLIGIILIALTNKSFYLLADNYTHSKYYKSTEIKIEVKDNSTYLINFSHSEPTNRPLEKGQFKFTEEKISLQHKTMAIIRHGLDLKPLWQANFKEGELINFTEFRREEMEAFNEDLPRTQYFLKDKKLLSYNHLIRGTRFLEVFEYDAFRDKIIKHTSFIGGKIKYTRKYQYNKNMLELVSVYQQIPETMQKEMLYYYKVSPLKSEGELSREDITYFTPKHIPYQKMGKVYQKGRLVKINFPEKFSIHYKWETGADLTTTVMSDKVHSITTLGVNPPQDEIVDFQLLTMPKSIYLIEHKKMNFKSKPSQIAYTWISPRGFINKQIVLFYEKGDISRLYTKFSPNAHEVIFNSRYLVERKNIYDQRFKLLNYYAYQYNSKNWIIEEKLLDTKGNLKKKIEYIYGPANNTRPISHENLLGIYGIKSSTQEKPLVYQGSYFSYRGLIKDIEERLTNRKVDHRHRENVDKQRKKLLNALLETYDSKLKKVVHYNYKNQVSSYVKVDSFLDSKTKDRRIKFAYYNRPINFKFTHNKHNLEEHFQKRDMLSTGNTKSVGLTNEAAEHLLGYTREYLKEVHTFHFDNKGIKNFSVETFNSHTGKTFKKKGIIQDGQFAKPYFEKRGKSSHDILSENFVEELISVE